MARHIPPEKKQAIRDAFAREAITYGELATRFGISRQSVSNILRTVERDEMPPATVKGPIKFRLAKRYFCEACRTHAYVRPCPACVARRARARGEKSAVARHGLDRKDPSRDWFPSAKPSAPEDAVDVKVPEAVPAWLYEKLTMMIGSEGRHVDVTEAVEDLMLELHQIVSAVAGPIGESRRFQVVKKKLATNSPCQPQ